ncbi:MAG: GTPase [Eubacterium sp.]|nr:GTPase [Eubacterium sp.]
MAENKLPIYLFTGFMDSGKTSLIKDTIFDGEFTEGAHVLLIVCEDGDEEYDEADLIKHRVTKVDIENEEDFTAENIIRYADEANPDMIFIEYNGTWQISAVSDVLEDKAFSQDFDLVQCLTTVEGPTFDSFLTNMRTMMMDQIFLSDVVIINRSSDDLPKSKFRAAIKANNKRAQIVYERPDGSIDEKAMSELPYDKSQDRLDLSDSDYALFYMDIMDNPKDYKGKTISFRALIYNPDDYKPGQYVPGRFAMTCCEADIQFMGLICKSKNAASIAHKSWVDLTAKVSYEYDKDYGGKGPVLYEVETKPADKPEDELVYFS